MSKGDLVWIAESDDLCENDLLEILVKESTTDNECALAFCKSMTINSTGDITGEKGLSNNLHVKWRVFFQKLLIQI